MIHLRSISLKPAARKIDEFPFRLPLFQKLKELKFRRPVTFLVGENGSGKSTLLEGIAAAAGSIVVGGSDIRSDRTLAHARRLGAQLSLVWQQRTHRGLKAAKHSERLGCPRYLA